MKRISVFLFLFVIVLFKATPQNLVLNGGFENGLDYWGYFGTEPANAILTPVTSPVHSGNKSLYIRNHGSDTVKTFILQVLPVVPQHHYYLEYYIKSDSISSFIFPITRFRNDTVGIFESYMLPSGNLPVWTQVQSRFIAPDSADNLIFAIALMGNGKLWLDDVLMVELDDTAYTSYDVFPDSVTGSFNRLFQTNHGPKNISQPDNLIAGFQDMQIDLARTHDYSNAFDYHAIFPDTSRNPLDPSAYMFHNTDSCIANILAAGCDVYFRLGESWEATQHYCVVPYDMEKFAQVCVQIIKHYNEGWNNGFNYNLKYFEVWNEPDISEFWNGDVYDFCKLYHITADKIKAYDSSLFVGGPTVSNMFNDHFVDTFLDSVSINHIPLDFFSYHFYYFYNPYYYKKVNEIAKQKLTNKGLGNAKLINSEWNPFLYSFTYPSSYGDNDAHNAAATASILTYMQTSDIFKMVRYRTGGDNFYFSTFETDGSYTYGGSALKAQSDLMKLPDRIYSTGGDTLGSSIIAAQNNSNGDLQIVIADNSSSSFGYNLNFHDMEYSGFYQYHLYRIDKDHKYAVVDSGIISQANPVLQAKARAPFVDHIVASKVLSVTVNEENQDFSVFPNPFTESLFLKINDVNTAKTLTIRIFDYTGQLLQMLTYSNLSSGGSLIDLGEPLSVARTGIYFLQINFGETIFENIKVIKI